MIPRFRAWDTHEQKMFANNELIIWNGNVYANDSKKLTCNNLKGWSIDDEYLMQSTGLKDKNGKEIFEGDILAVETDEEVVNLNVFWDEEHALFMFESKKYNEKDLLAELVEDKAYPFEIIGNIYENIYENPELLEDKE